MSQSDRDQPPLIPLQYRISIPPSAAAPLIYAACSVGVGCIGTIAAFNFASMLNINGGPLFRRIGNTDSRVLLTITICSTFVIGLLLGTIAVTRSRARLRPICLAILGIAISCSGPFVVSKIETDHIAAKVQLHDVL